MSFVSEFLRMVERQPMLRIFGEEIPLRARVEILNGLKSGQQVALEDPTKKRVEKDEEDN